MFYHMQFHFVYSETIIQGAGFPTDGYRWEESERNQFFLDPMNPIVTSPESRNQNLMCDSELGTRHQPTQNRDYEDKSQAVGGHSNS